LRLLDLATGEERPLPEFGEIPRNIARPFDLDGSGSVVASGDADGLIRVGRVGGGEPHLLVGHEGPAGVAISPDGRWVASTGEDGALRLWPMPDLDKPPLHTLPHDELLAELRSLTNIRVVRDPESAEGWKVTLDPFPGWAEVPTW
jgi:WD40 repeat protein